MALFGWIRVVRGLVLTAASNLYERVGGAMDTIPLGRLVFGVLVASPAAKDTSMTKAVDRTSLSTSTRNFVF